jgi:hypothetical protein
MGDSKSLVGPAAQRRQIEELKATVQVLVDMLADALLVDRELLRERVALRLEQERDDPTPMPDPWLAVAATKPIHVSGDPYRDAPRGEHTVICGVCQRVVAERLTVITAEGVICDVCAARKR